MSLRKAGVSVGVLLFFFLSVPFAFAQTVPTCKAGFQLACSRSTHECTCVAGGGSGGLLSLPSSTLNDLGVSSKSNTSNSAAPVKLVNPLGGQNFQQVTANIISFILNDIAIPLTVIMVLVGAFEMITSGGNAEKVSKGRKTLLYAAIGFAVVLLASGVTSLIQNILGG